VLVLKETKEEYVKRMKNLVDEEMINETWEQFKVKFKKEHKMLPDFWINFMELDDADFTDLKLYSADANFYERVYGGDRGNKLVILNKQVFGKLRKQLSGKLPDHIQTETEGCTGIGKSTFALAMNVLLFPKFNSKLIHYMKQDALDFIKDNPELVRKNCLMLDEDVEEHGIGTRRTESDLGQIIESCRKAEVSFARCRAVAKHKNQTVRYVFLVFAKNVSRRLTCAAVYRMDMCIGFVILRIPYTTQFFELEYEYNIKKDAFIDSTLNQENTSKINVEKCAEKLLNDPKIKLLQKIGKKELKLFVYKHYNNLTTLEQELIVTEAWLQIQGGIINEEESF